MKAETLRVHYRISRTQTGLGIQSTCKKCLLEWRNEGRKERKNEQRAACTDTSPLSNISTNSQAFLIIGGSRAWKCNIQLLSIYLYLKEFLNIATISCTNAKKETFLIFAPRNLPNLTSLHLPVFSDFCPTGSGGSVPAPGATDAPRHRIFPTAVPTPIPGHLMLALSRRSALPVPLEVHSHRHAKKLLNRVPYS